MLRYLDYRREMSEPESANSLLCEADKTVEDAFDKLFRSELMFGGQVTVLTPTRIETQTRVMSKLDTTVVTGEEAEMAPLVAVVATYVTVQHDRHENIVQRAADELMRVAGEKDSKGKDTVKPLFAAMLAGPLMGQATLKEMLASLHIDPETQ